MDPAAGLQGQAASLAAHGLLALLLVLDLTFVCGHIWLAPSNAIWSVELENSYAERFQHLKWLCACLLLLVLALKRRSTIYFVWAAIFAYFLVDDATMLHERFGAWLSEVPLLLWVHQAYIDRFPHMFLRPQDFGEMTVALIAAAIVILLVVSSLPSASRHDRRVTKRLIVWLGLFAFFAVGVDTVHIMALDPATGTFSPMGELLGILEDGGEMICASLLVGGLALELARGSAASGTDLLTPDPIA